MDIPISQQNIINILGVESLPDEQKIALIEKITKLVQKRLVVRVLDFLDESKQQEFGALLEQDGAEKISGFLETNVPDFPAWVEEEVNQVKQELKGMVEGMEV